MSRPWTVEGLMAAYMILMSGGSLEDAAEATGRFRQEIDLAMQAKLGRSPKQAVERLNAVAQGEAPPPPPSRKPISAVLAHFLRDILP